MSVDFGSVGVGQSSLATLVIANPGACSTDALALAITGPQAASFVVMGSSCPGQRITTGTCDIDVAFAPMVTGAKSAELWIEGAGVPLVVPLSGAALTASHWFLGGSPHDFAATMVSETSASHRFTVNNFTPYPATISRSFSGSTSEFGIVGDTCTGSPVPAGATCAIDVVFHPTSVGMKIASLTLTSSMHGQLTASMSGMALPNVSWSISPTMADLGAVQLSQVSAPERFTIANTGQVASSPSIGVSFAGADAMEFGPVDNTCSSVVLPPGATCHVDVVYHPTHPGAAAASLVLSDSALGSLSVPLSGTGVTAGGNSFFVTPETIDFGPSAAPGDQQSVTVTYMGGGVPSGAITVALTGDAPASYQIVDDTCTGTVLPAFATPPASCTFAVRTTCVGAGSVAKASVKVSGMPGGWRWVALKATVATASCPP